MSNHTSIRQFEPNYLISIKYSKKNLTEFVNELSSINLNCITRPSNVPTDILIFTKINSTDKFEEQSLFDILSKHDNIVNSILPIQHPEKVKQLNFFLDNKILNLSNFLLPITDPELTQLYDLSLKNPNLILYFSFFKTYINWLFPLSIFGIILRLIFSSNNGYEFSYIFLITLIFWSILFTANWLYNSKKIYLLKFTNDENSIISYKKNYKNLNTTHSSIILKKLAFIPVALVFTIIVLSFQLLCFFIEIFITQLYDGPLVPIFSLIPTILLSVFVPIITIIYNIFVKMFVNWENGPTSKDSIVEKNLVLTFLTSYVPLFITLFFYLPFGHNFTSDMKYQLNEKVSNYYDIPIINHDFEINIDRFRSQFFYFVVTNQVVATLLGNLVPFILSKIFGKKKPAKDDMKAQNINYIMKTKYANDFTSWDKYLSELSSTFGEFDVDENYKKVLMQFGYLVMFSTIWPLAPAIYLFFNLINYKLDIWRAYKKCRPSSSLAINIKKPSIETFDDELNLWDQILKLLCWLGILISTIITILYKNCNLPGVGRFNYLEKREDWYQYSILTHTSSWFGIILAALAAEHISFFVFYIVSLLIKNLNVNSLNPNNSKSKRDQNINEKDINNSSSLDLSNVINESIDNMDNILVLDIPADDSKEIIHEKDITNDSSEALNNNSTTYINEDEDYDNERSNDTARNIRKPSRETPIRSNTANTNITSPSKRSSRLIPPQSRNEESSIVSSTVAGATLPDTIPTSKNYHLRNGHEGIVEKVVEAAEEKLGATPKKSTIEKPPHHHHHSEESTPKRSSSIRKPPAKKQSATSSPAQTPSKEEPKKKRGLFGRKK